MVSAKTVNQAHKYGIKLHSSGGSPRREQTLKNMIRKATTQHVKAPADVERAFQTAITHIKQNDPGISHWITTHASSLDALIDTIIPPETKIVDQSSVEAWTDYYDAHMSSSDILIEIITRLPKRSNANSFLILLPLVVTRRVMAWILARICAYTGRRVPSA